MSRGTVVVKIGSSTLVDARGRARPRVFGQLAADVAALTAAGTPVVLVSSGAIAMGLGSLGREQRSRRLPELQAASAIGQSLLLRRWEAALGRKGLRCAQVLLTVGDIHRRDGYLNARRTLETLLGWGRVPVVNENDSTATDEITFGDNDALAAQVAVLLKARLLVLLTDIDGLHDRDPRRPDAVPIAEVDDHRLLERLELDKGRSSWGSGGMRSKLVAARIASGAGCATLIASGREDHPIAALSEGARATLVAAKGSAAGAYKQWIAGTLKPAGSLAVDAGAARALAGGKSLLPAGIVAVTGAFERGVCLSIVGPDGRELARGISAYNSDEARLIAGHATSRIEELLGYGGPDALIHRDDLVMLTR